MTTWNMRYVAYAAANGLSPEAMLEADQARYPGGCMCDYIIWIGQRWAEFRKLFARDRHITTEQYHADFDAWLLTKAHGT